MSTRVDPDAQSASALSAVSVQAGAVAGPSPVESDPDDRWGGPALPSDHPRWMKDTLSLSQRARALLTKLKPIVIRVVNYWEHRVRSIAIGNARLSIDASGSYRLD